MQAIHFSRVFAALLCLGAASSGVDVAAVAPQSAGTSKERLAEVTRGLEDSVASGAIAGAVAVVARDGRQIYSAAVGLRDRATAAPMTPDTLFRIYSMTRPMTSVAVLMLQDDGRLSIDDPVAKFLPGFTAQRVLSDPGATDSSQTRARRGEMTIRHLLTHTSGIGERASRLYADRKVRSWSMPLATVVDNYASAPLFEDPGTAFRYGESAEILGRIIEVASGMPLEAFLERRLFTPLGMTDTVFFVDRAGARRLAVTYRRAENGTLVPHEIEPTPVTERRALVSGGVGLVSTASDLLRFGQFVLDGGVAGGRRLLSPAAARLLREDAIPQELEPIGRTGYWPGTGWTLGGFALVADPVAYDHRVDRGEIWWDGSAGTRFWINPHNGVVAVVLAQIVPAGGGGFRETFKTRLQNALTE